MIEKGIFRDSITIPKYEPVEKKTETKIPEYKTVDYGKVPGVYKLGLDHVITLQKEGKTVITSLSSLKAEKLGYASRDTQFR